MSLKIGSAVQALGNNKTYIGKLAFVGAVEFGKGTWAGIILEEQGTGKNDGSVNGVSYFKCPENTGVFVLASKVKLYQSKPPAKKALATKKPAESKKQIEPKAAKPVEKTSLPKRAPSTIPRATTPRAATPKPASSKPVAKPTPAKTPTSRSATPKPIVKSSASTRVNSPKTTDTALTDKITQLEKELAGLKAVGSSADINLLKEQLSGAEQTKSTLETKNAESAEKIRSLVDELMSKNHLEAQLETSQSELNLLSSKYSDLESQFKATSAELETNIQKLRESSVQIQTLDDIKIELKQSLTANSALNSSIETLESQLSELQLSESKQAQTSPAEDQQKLKDEIAELKKKNETLLDDLEEGQVAKNLLQEKLMFLQKELNNASSKAETLESTIAEKAAEYESSKTQLAEAKEAAETKVEETNRFFEVVQNNYNSTLEYVGQLQTKEAELTQNLSNTSQELEVTKNVCEELRGYIVELENGLPAIKESGSEEQEELIEQLRKENKTVKQTAQTLNAEYEDAIRKCENYEFQISALQKQLNDQSSGPENAELLKNELEQSKSQIESLQTFILDLQAKLEMADSNQDLIAELKEKEAALTAMSKQVELLQKKIEQCHTENENLERSLNDCRSALDSSAKQETDNTYQELEAELQTQMLENHNLQSKLGEAEALCSQLKESLKDSVILSETSKIEYSTLQSDYSAVMSKQNEYYQHIEDLKDHIDELQGKLQEANNYIKLQEDNQQETDMDSEKLKSALVEKRNEMEDLRSSLTSLMDNMTGILEKCEEQAKALYVMYPDEDGMTQLVQDISCLLMLQEQMDELMVSFQWIKKSINF
ncbi:CAP-Gly domain-containing linker protein 4 [Terramyces sp. JEL0728]|nr:CAP-Gly domain-containing linker protein 4 [Terramyces sp. JEL0728]